MSGEPLLPIDTRGKPRADDRRVISRIIHVQLSREFSPELKTHRPAEFEKNN